jgi:hypothetical protein
MTRKLLIRALILGGAVAGVLSTQVDGFALTKQVFLGAPADPNIYCSGPCGTGSCCVIN